MDSSRGTDTFLTAIFFWPLHNVDFLLVCWHLKTLILWSNWYSSAASTQYFPALFDVGVIYYPLPAVGKLVHCDKMCEFTRRQEPLNAHHSGTAANVGHIPVLILPGAFQRMQCHHGTGLDAHPQPGTGGTSPYKQHWPSCVKPRWKKNHSQFNYNLIKGANLASKQDEHHRSMSLPLFLFFSPALPQLPYASPAWAAGPCRAWGRHHGGRAPAPHSWPSAGHRKQFIPLLMIYVISLDSLLA